MFCAAVISLLSFLDSCVKEATLNVAQHTHGRFAEYGRFRKLENVLVSTHTSFDAGNHLTDYFTQLTFQRAPRCPLVPTAAPR